MTSRSFSLAFLLLVLVAALLPPVYTRRICNQVRSCGAAFGKRAGEIQIPQSIDDIELPLQRNRDFELQSGPDASDNNMGLLKTLLQLLPQERQQRIKEDLRKALEDELILSRRR